ncbi:hypothetical protein [Reyranella sp.]|jgi:hypothetical protein|uniref:hypothetical protein n=1 Tax=Reyranella sp. TaxID=1929291 RepID=UPI000BDB55DF|nr:hypothetical protein [Reyranella sp.]OYY44020.1 MAG: hypothetical protein B7Y57_07500 [Rhodospirillales bacterium 35-66-84]OYZ94696.1 MAG: hypothetical protein B7Y08_10380 [Rhodospirillales bacterium 24-66-33]OZB26230.1 MAG: hypothetical protein B7X63_09830 [Rhodospirillales bacterium 39-66-50]HQS15050.1 hypothetical protein [Reyranella sp.]HQT10859.1 hypothetical protein [Reyranella sp.]
MWSAIATMAAAALGFLGKLMAGDGGKADQRELGRAEQQVTDLKTGTATIRAATEAAHEAETRPEPDHDPNDRSLRR